MKQIILGILLFANFAGNAQNLLVPSKNSFEKKWITNNTYEMIWYMMQDTAKFEFGRMKTQIKIENKNLIVVTEVKMKNMKLPMIDSTIADLTTLSPIKHSSSAMQRDMVLNFGEIVTGYYNDKMSKKNTNISDTVKGKYFDSNLYPTLIGWLPLANGYTTDISIYDYNPEKKGIMKAMVKSVTSGTYLTEKNGNREVWIVEVSDEIGSGDADCTYYFDKLNRRLWKQEINVGGRKMLMKLVE